jgi:hypothetical protein
VVAEGGHKARADILDALCEDLRQRDGESGQQLGLLKGVARICTTDFRLELAGNVTVGEAGVRVEEPASYRCSSS